MSVAVFVLFKYVWLNALLVEEINYIFCNNVLYVLFSFAVSTGKYCADAVSIVVTNRTRVKNSRFIISIIGL